MAKTETTPPKSGNTIPFPQAETGVAEPESSIPAEFSAETPPADHKPKVGRPRKGSEPPETDFFRRVAAVATADWGTRVYLYLYQLEPVCDLKQSGGKAYLMRYQSPVTDEHQIMLEQGSGKYRLVLSGNKVSPLTSNEIARYEFEIYNPKYPPKIPRVVWVKDPRNTRWEALLPPEAPAQPPAAPASSLIEGDRFYREIRDEVKTELGPAEEPRARANEVLETMKAAKELFAPASPAPTAEAQSAEKPTPVDPWAAAEKILNMRADNPMMGILQEQMKATAAAQEAERERAFKAAEAAREREFKLQQQLLEAKTTTTAPSKGALDQLIELAGALDRLGPLKAIFGGGASAAAETTVRAVRSTTLDVVRDVVKDFLGSPLATGVGQWLGSRAQQMVGPPPAMNPGVPQQQAVPSPANDLPTFLNNVLNPALLRHYLQGFSGGEFAGWLYDAFPERLKELQQFTHPRLPGLSGAAAIITAYKHTEAMWPTLSTARPAGEAAFTEFVSEFCAWKPEEEVADAEPVDGQQGEDTEDEPERIS